MKKLIGTLVTLAILTALFLLSGPFYTVNEGEQALVVRLGQIVAVRQEAGLHIKTPFLDIVHKYPRRILSWDGEKQSILTREKNTIWVDTTARWRISDPVKYYESITSLEGGFRRLNDVIDSAVRTIVADNWLREVVRNSNYIVDVKDLDELDLGDGIDAEKLGLDELEDSHERIIKGRRHLSEEILERARKLVPEYGIELIDVVIRQINYDNKLTQSVYDRMIKERNQIAQAIRSEGEGKRAELMGRLENEQRRILSTAYANSETIKGSADAEASALYANAYTKDPEFYTFWRAMESYRQTIPGFNKTLSTDMDYFRYLYSPNAKNRR
jgi:membrane protease subunit HflC